MNKAALSRSLGLSRSVVSRALSAGSATSWALGQRIAAQLDAAEVDAWLWRLRGGEGSPPSLAQLGGLLRELPADEAARLIPRLRDLLRGSPLDPAVAAPPALGAPGADISALGGARPSGPSLESLWPSLELLLVLRALDEDGALEKIYGLQFDRSAHPDRDLSPLEKALLRWRDTGYQL